MFKILRKPYKFLTHSYHWWKFRKANCRLDQISLGSEYPWNFQIKCPEKLSIGIHTSISGPCFINALGVVTIGKYCHIAKGLTIYAHNHNWRSKTTIPYDAEVLPAPVEIGDAVWFGANVCVAPGAKIGNGAIISMGSVVFGEIPECAIARGNPAAVVGYRDKETFYNLYKEGKFG